MKYNYKCVMAKNGNKMFYKNNKGKWERISNKVGEKMEKGKKKYRAEEKKGKIIWDIPSSLIHPLYEEFDVFTLREMLQTSPNMFAYHNSLIKPRNLQEEFNKEGYELLPPLEEYGKMLDEWIEEGGILIGRKKPMMALYASRLEEMKNRPSTDSRTSSPLSAISYNPDVDVGDTVHEDNPPHPDDYNTDDDDDDDEDLYNF